MERRPIMLSVHERGTTHQRFVVSDSHLRFWDGSGWQSDERLARLYATSSEAACVVQQLLMIHYTGRKVRRYVAPVIVDLYSDQEITEEELQAWLVRAARLILHAPQHGNGPVEGSLGLCSIHWHQIEKVKE